MVLCSMVVFLNEVILTASQLFFQRNIFEMVLTMRVIIPFIFDIHSLMPGLIIVCTVPQLRQITFGGIFDAGDNTKTIFVSTVSLKQ
ncbi:unnamed protein product [Bursaphelenchus okinawaensis]|uniref:Uncharacterized protein n=1 Tax=Bursaphelenchus okinawaensis TaxID=465554 RepID=A0A811LLH4_9BILA|nr:unnamed protein product [Bursaphelenchus okinawaensis]CAG9124585.1 unnamed protein product [Bursaphelenchus okinawaensis]